MWRMKARYQNLSDTRLGNWLDEEGDGGVKLKMTSWTVSVNSGAVS